jgi:murein L,D-transpeptidase YcbB/YkuD
MGGVAQVLFARSVAEQPAVCGIVHKESKGGPCMRKGLIVCSFLAMAATLSGCDRVGADTVTEAGKEVENLRWSADAIKQLRQAIDGRAAHALDRMDFALADPASDEGQQALTQSALRYASALARGVTDPTKLYDIYTVPRPDPDLRQGLAEALADGKVTRWLDSLAPQGEDYRTLSKAYLALRKQRQAPATVISEPAKPLNPGATDLRIPAIARQLVALDYLSPSDAQGTSYSPAMVRAIKRMQTDYGIDPDGMIGSDALEILNLSDADRMRAIAVAMERLRWLDRQPPATRIDVNLAAARLTYWRDGKIADRRKVVVGEPDKETPQIGSPIYRLVANPTWTVPRSIQNKEIAGKGAAYLRRNNMVWKNGWIVQQPGPKNSLGLVKFDMKNGNEIYLHDTPAKQLFDEVQRQRSHGCVRVEDALGFAAMLAKDEGILDKWNEARATGKESFVGLPRAIPVRMLYQTVLIDDAGQPVVRADPYGWNDRVATALGFAKTESRRLHAGGEDLGP